MKLTTKSEEDIQGLLKGIKKVAIVACKSCFKEFMSDRAEAVEELVHSIKSSGRDVLQVSEADFLCLRRSTERLMASLDCADTDAVLTYSCGVGTQVVASMTDKMVIPAANTDGYRFFGGFYPTDTKLCQACGECVLNETAGICPVAYCSKGLVNGPCGGAQDGKCEVDSEKDCVWLKIYERLEKQGRLENMRSGVRIHDRSGPGYSKYYAMVNAVQKERDESFAGGVHPEEHKAITSGSKIIDAPVPEQVSVPLIQHIGRQCRPVVEAGDVVRRGQMIGKSEAFISAPVHSPVSGKVLAVEPRPHPVISADVLSVVIENDGQDTLHPDVIPLESADDLSAEDIVDIVRKKGITGMGGAMFPTYVKLQPQKPVDTLILNGCECEPYLTSDHRIMVEEPEKVIGGLRLIARALKVDRCLIGIEENKPDAIAAMREVCGEGELVKEMPVKYPQGAEKMLIKALTDRIVPADGLPLDVGVTVSNVGTSVAVYDAVFSGIPLVERVVTVGGQDIAEPGNYRVRIGTSFRELLGKEDLHIIEDRYDVRMGGPMMGLTQANLDVPVVKGTTGLTVVPKPDIPVSEERTCVRCGRCMEVCPMELKPHQIWHYVTNEEWSELADLKPNECIECGACEYICSSKLPLVSLIKKAKEKVKQ